MTTDTIGGVNALVVPGFGVHTVYAEKHEVAGVQLVVQGSNHQLIFILMEAPHRRRKYEYGMAGMAELKELHVLVQVGAPPAMIFTVHETTG